MKEHLSTSDSVVFPQSFKFDFLKKLSEYPDLKKIMEGMMLGVHNGQEFVLALDSSGLSKSDKEIVLTKIVETILKELNPAEASSALESYNRLILTSGPHSRLGKFYRTQVATHSQRQRTYQRLAIETLDAIAFSDNNETLDSIVQYLLNKKTNKDLNTIISEIVKLQTNSSVADSILVNTLRMIDETRDWMALSEQPERSMVA